MRDLENKIWDIIHQTKIDLSVNDAVQQIIQAIEESKQPEPQPYTSDMWPEVQNA